LAVLNVNVPPPVFVTVTVCDGDNWPRVTVPKARVVGDTKAEGVVEVPVPLSATATVVFPAAAIFRAADSAIAAVGVNFMVMVQVAPAALVGVQVVEL
jgi:hypothetical protein